MPHHIDDEKRLDETRIMHGRRLILTTETEITDENILDVVLKAMETHSINSSEIDYLWKYRNGDQPILHRVKKGSFEDIVNKIIENRASEIIDFKVGYYVGEPIQYTSKKDDDKSLTEMKRFNDYMYANNKASQDQDLVEWNMICGTAFRMVLPNTNTLMASEKPFEMFTLDPRETFVVRSVELGNKPMLGVKYYKGTNEQFVFTCYSDTRKWVITENNIISKEDHAYGTIPIIEYPANNARMGAFEIVLPLLDMLNKIDSNRMDGIEQTIEAFIKFVNCEIDKDQFEEFKAMGAIMIKSTEGGQADVDVVTTNLDQNQTHTTREDVYDAIIEICGMPARTGGASTSDTGAAVILRDGYALAESRAKVFENMFKRSEMEMIDFALHICNWIDKVEDINLKSWEIETKFTRRNYENIVSKAQVLDEMLNNPKIHPILAFQSCGLFPDPEAAYVLSDKYYQDMMDKYEVKEVPENEESLRADRQIAEEDQGNDNKRIQASD